VRYLTTALLQYCTICQIVDLASIGVPGSQQPLLLNADDKSFIFSTGSFIVLAADHHEVLCRSCGREVADPAFLKVSPLSPDFLQRQNLTLFGSAVRLPVEKLRNPAGFEFEVVTFERTGCLGVGSWTPEASWYPGYLWKACICPKCRSHLGWMFEPEESATEDREKPSEAGFYAIILSKVIDEDFASTLTLGARLDRNPAL